MKSYFSHLQTVALLLLIVGVPRAVVAAANDNLANAQVIPPGSFQVTGNNNGATTEAFEKVNGYPMAVNANTVWYSYTPTASGFLTLGTRRTSGSAEGSTLATGVFKGPETPSKETIVAENQETATTINNLHVDAGQQYLITLADDKYPGDYTFTGTFTPDPAFFSGEKLLPDGVYYLGLSGDNVFGYYTYDVVSFYTLYQSKSEFIYHFDLGYECLFDANDGEDGVYLYDFASKTFFYTSPGFAFPYLYDFTLNAVLYYYPDTNNSGHYTTNPRYFYNLATGQIITK